MDSLGKRIRKIRESQGFSQSDLARRASISNEYVGKIEREEVTNIGTEVVASIAEALSVHPSLLLYGEVTTPKMTLKDQGELWPLKDEEKILVENYRKVSATKREILQKIVKEFAKK